MQLSGIGYGLLYEWEMQIAPWKEVIIDLIGPWTVEVNNRNVEFNTLTCIDMASNMAEFIRIDNKPLHHTRDKFVQSWLSHYPHPVCCIHDKGCEFIGSTFQWPLHSFDIKDVQSTIKNPQPNSICESMHKKVGSVLWKLLYSIQQCTTKFNTG
jgi:hypothetical protein